MKQQSLYSKLKKSSKQLKTAISKGNTSNFERRLIKTTEALILKESFEYCPYIRAMQKEKRRNAVIQNNDKRLESEMDADIPEVTKLKAHLKRRVERQTKQKWVQYATEYASEIVMSGPVEREAMRKYLDMTKEAVLDMNRKSATKKKESKYRRRVKNTPFNEETY